MEHLQRQRCIRHSRSSHYWLDFREDGTMSSYFPCEHHEQYVIHRCFTIYWTNYKFIEHLTKLKGCLILFQICIATNEISLQHSPVTKLAWPQTEWNVWGVSYQQDSRQPGSFLPGALVSWTHWSGPCLNLWVCWASNSEQWPSPMKLVLSYTVNPM